MPHARTLRSITHTGRAIALAGLLIMVTTATGRAIYAFQFSPRAQAQRFYDQLTPGMTYAEVKRMDVDINDIKGVNGVTTAWAAFGAPGPTQCFSLATFDPKTGILRSKFIDIGEEQTPRWLAQSMEAIGIPSLDRTQRWP